MSPVEQRRVLVTGAAGGIGLAVCERLLARGDATVLAVDRERQLVRLQEHLAAGGRVVDLPADLSDPASVERLGSAVAADGGLDGIVNVAGTEGRVFAPVHELSREEFDHVLGINLAGMFDVCRVLLPQLLESGNATIVNVASVAGLVCFPHQSPYVVSKHGVIGLTKALALDYAAQGIRANCVCPGLVATDMMSRVEEAVGGQEAADRLMRAVPVGRYCAPDEIADAIVWLLLDAPGVLTGAVLTIDGGWTLK